MMMMPDNLQLIFPFKLSNSAFEVSYKNALYKFTVIIIIIIIITVCDIYGPVTIVGWFSL